MHLIKLEKFRKNIKEMNQTINLRELDERIKEQSSFVDSLIMGMDSTIVGQKHLVKSLLIFTFDIFCTFASI